MQTKILQFTMAKRIIVGMPYFHNIIETCFVTPVGSEDLFKRISKEIKSGKKLQAKLAQEHFAILSKIIEMGYEPKVCTIDVLGEIVCETIKRRMSHTVEMISVPKEFPAPVYIRDAWMLVDTTALIPSVMSPVWLSFMGPEIQFTTSIFGEGGKVLTLDDYFITTKITDGDNHLEPTKLRMSDAHVPLIEKKFIFLTNPVSVSIEDGISYYEPEIHVDRFISLIKDTQGALHAIIDPSICIGFQSHLSKPTRSMKESVLEIGGILKKNGIEHVHVPEKPLNIPYALGVMQFHDGRVLMSGGTNVESLYQYILGKENVFTTDVPIRYYSSMRRAGLHCLINEY